jgi:hypothetical protein
MNKTLSSLLLGAAMLPLAVLGQYSDVRVDALGNIVNTVPINYATDHLLVNGVPVGAGGGGGSGVNLTVPITQTAHGLAVGNVVRFNGTNYVKAQADSAVNAEVVGIVSAVANANTFTLLLSGDISGLSGLSAGSTYFLSPSVAGGLTTTDPTTIGQISKPLLIADTSATGYFNNWRGMVNATTGGAPTTSTYITQTPDATLSAEQPLSALATGLMKSTTTTGVVSTIPDNSTNWDTAFTDRLKWDGGATGLVAATGRTSLGLVVGTNVQAWDADLDTWATLTPSANFQTMIPHTFAQMRTDLGLVIGTNVEAWSANLDAWSALATSAKQNADGDLTALAALTGTNTIYYRSAADTWSAVTIGSNMTFSAGTLNSVAGGSGTVTTTGSPATGNLTKFSGATSITNADLTGDITTTGTTATTIANDAVTYAKMQNVAAESVLARANSASGDVGEVALAASQLLGRGSTGDVAAITLGTNLSMSGATLNATGGGGGTPGGSTTQVQYNNAGAFGGITNLTTDGTNVTALSLGSTVIEKWSTDTGLVRNAAGLLEINNGTAGQYRDLIARNAQITTGIKDTNGNSMLAFTSTASAVDGFTFTNAATGSPVVTMAATGTDTNITLGLRAKGSSPVNVVNNADQTAPLFELVNTNNHALAQTSFITKADGSNQTQFGTTSTLRTAYGALLGATGFMYSTLPLVFMSDSVSGYIDFAPGSGGAGSKARVFASGGLSVNSTSDPGAGIINANTGYRVTNAAPTNYELTGNGTNFVAKASDIPNGSSAQQTGFTADQYLTGSTITVNAGDFTVGSQYRCTFDMAKTGGTATPIVTIRVGTAGTTSDAAVQTITWGAGTAIADTGTFEVRVNFRAVGASATVASFGQCNHNLASTGLTSTGASGNGTISNTTSATFNSTAATKIGISFNGGASFGGTNNIVQAVYNQP